jgi:hypothetical protein
MRQAQKPKPPKLRVIQEGVNPDKHQKPKNIFQKIIYNRKRKSQKNNGN